MAQATERMTLLDPGADISTADKSVDNVGPVCRCSRSYSRRFGQLKCLICKVYVSNKWLRQKLVLKSPYW